MLLLLLRPYRGRDSGKTAKNASQAGSDPHSCPRKFSTADKQIVIIPRSLAALTNARKSNFSALILSDVKTPSGNSADYTSMQRLKTSAEWAS